MSKWRPNKRRPKCFCAFRLQQMTTVNDHSLFFFSFKQNKNKMSLCFQKHSATSKYILFIMHCFSSKFKMHKKLLLLLQISRNRMHAYVKSQIVIKQSKCIWCLFNIRALNQFTFLIKGPLQDEVFEFNSLHIQRNLFTSKHGLFVSFLSENYTFDRI